MKAKFDPSWNEIRAMSVRTLAVLLLQEKVPERTVRRQLRSAGYLAVETDWAIPAAREHLRRLHEQRRQVRRKRRPQVPALITQPVPAQWGLPRRPGGPAGASGRGRMGLKASANDPVAWGAAAANTDVARGADRYVRRLAQYCEYEPSLTQKTYCGSVWLTIVEQRSRSH
jgi:hypothetical protein